MPYKLEDVCECCITLIIICIIINVNFLKNVEWVQGALRNTSLRLRLSKMCELQEYSLYEQLVSD